MNYTGILFALLTTLSWAICIFPFTRAARLLGANTLNHFRLALATLVVCVISILAAPSEFGNLFSSRFLPVWFWLGLSGIIGLTIGDYFAFVMYSILGARLGSVLTTFAPAAALFLGYFMNDEHISWIGIIGIAITITGVIRISLGKGERKLIPDLNHGSVLKGIIAGVLAAFCQGAGLVMAKKGIISAEHLSSPINPFHASFIRLFIGTSSLVILTTLRGKSAETWSPLLTNREGGIRYAVSGTIFGPILGVTLSLCTVAYLDASVAQTIFSMIPVLALFIAYFLLRERITAKALTGVCIAVAGVIILIWREQLKTLL